MWKHTLILAVLSALAGGNARCGMFAQAGKTRNERKARVVLSSGKSLDKARVSARADLKILVFVKEKKKRVEVEFRHIVRLQQFVLEEGMEREWRWKEGGVDEKIYTGRAYPWRKYGVRITLDTGKVISGKITSGFPLRITWTPKPGLSEADRKRQKRLLDEMNRNAGNTMTARQRALLQAKLRRMQEQARAASAKPRTRTFVINAKNKGGMGEKLKDLVYVRDIDFREKQP